MKVRHGILLGGALLAGFGSPGCSEDKTPAPATPVASSAARTSAAAPAASQALPPTDDQPAQPGRDGPLGALPSGASIYASFRPTVLDFVSEALPPRAKKELSKELEKLIGTGDLAGDGAAQKLGIDPSRPMLVATVPGDAKAAEGVMKTFGKNATRPGAAKIAAGAFGRMDIPLSGMIRLVVPTVDAKGSKYLQVVKKSSSDGLVVHQCPKHELCKPFKGAMPAFLLEQVGGALVAFYGEARSVRADIVPLTFSHLPREAERLAQFAGRSGGPASDRCKALDLDAPASVCVDGQASAEAGVASGYAMTFGALGSDAVDPSQRTKILGIGMAESEMNRKIGSPKKLLVEDGTLTLGGKPNKPKLTGSWLATDASKAKLEAAFAKQQCATKPAEVAGELLRKLQGAIGDAKREFASLTKAQEAIWESGWGAWPTLLARGWPAMLIHVPKGLDKEMPPIKGLEVCVGFRAGRLEASVTGDLKSVMPSP